MASRNSRYNELFSAVLDANESAVKRCLRAGWDPNSAGYIRIGDTEHLDYPLITAAKEGGTKIVELLLKHGANPSIKKAGGYNSLYNASNNGHLKIVKLLLAAGVDPNITLDSGYTPLIISAESNFPSVVACLLEAGANVNMIAGFSTCAIYNVTALHNAAEMNNKECCKLLVNAGARLDVVTNQGLTPIHVAAEKGALETVRYLISVGADIEKPDNDGRRPLYTAADYGKYDTVKVLLAAGAIVDAFTQEGRTALIQACITANVEVAKLLTTAGADVNANADLPKGHRQHGFTPLFGAVQQGTTEIVEVLLSAGAEPNTIHEQYSPLAFACEHGHADTVRCLLEHGVDADFMDTRSADGVTYTPLFRACREGEAEVVKVLLDFGVITTHRDTENNTCLMIAALSEHLEVVKLILDTPEGERLVNAAGKDGCTPLMVTASQAIVKALIDKGANVMCVDMYGNTALHCSVINESPPAVICTLVAAHADVMAVNNDQLTAADLAISEGNTLAETLLRRLEAAGNRTRVSVPAVPVQQVSVPPPSPTVRDVPIEAEDTKVEGIDDTAQQLSESEESRVSDSVSAVPMQHGAPIEIEEAKVEEGYDTQQLSDNEGSSSFVAPRKYKKKVRPCAHCGEITHRRCAGCKIAFYCSKQCQKTCYAAHKIECGRTKDEDNTDAKVSTLEECTSDAAGL